MVDLLLKCLRRRGILVQKIDHRTARLRNNPRAHFGIAEFVFCLRFKNGFFELDRKQRH